MVKNLLVNFNLWMHKLIQLGTDFSKDILVMNSSTVSTKFILWNFKKAKALNMQGVCVRARLVFVGRGLKRLTAKKEDKINK